MANPTAWTHSKTRHSHICGLPVSPQPLPPLHMLSPLPLTLGTRGGESISLSSSLTDSCLHTDTGQLWERHQMLSSPWEHVSNSPLSDLQGGGAWGHLRA